VRAPLLAAVVVIGLFSCAAALAEEKPPRHDEATRAWHGAIGAGTDFPIAVDLRGQLETPIRVRLSSSVGFMPGAYAGAINGFIRSTGAYDQATSDVVSSSFDTSFVFRAHAGFRPFPKEGFYFEAGYGRVAFGGDAHARDVVAAGTGRNLPPSAFGTLDAFHVSSTLHMLDVEVGWEFLTAKRLLLRGSLGGAFTFAATTTIERDTPGGTPPIVQPYVAEARTRLDQAYTSYGFTPVVGISGSFLVF
jgi:hypothetical protein